MSSIKSLMVSLTGSAGGRPSAAKPSPACEALEGRQLLSGTPWGWPGAANAAGMVPAQVRQIDKGGHHAFTPPTLSTEARAALKVLQADLQTLQTEVKADATVTAAARALKADQAAFDVALGKTAKAWTGPHGDPGGIANGSGPAVGFMGRPGHGHGPGFDGFGPGPVGTKVMPDPPAAVVSKLKAAGVTDAQITAFEDDAKALQTATGKVDPTLQATIAGEQQALAKLLPAPAAHFDHMKAPDAGTTAATTTTPGA